MRAKTVGGIKQAARVNGRKRQSARRNTAQWARIIEVQRRSDLTVVEFCRRRGIAKATFWYWRKRLVTAKKQGLIVNPAQRFLAVPIVAPAAAHIEVELGTLRLRLEGLAAARVIEAIVGRIDTGAQRGFLPRRCAPTCVPSPLTCASKLMVWRNWSSRCLPPIRSAGRCLFSWASGVTR